MTQDVSPRKKKNRRSSFIIGRYCNRRRRRCYSLKMKVPFDLACYSSSSSLSGGQKNYNYYEINGHNNDDNDEKNRVALSSLSSCRLSAALCLISFADCRFGVTRRASKRSVRRRHHCCRRLFHFDRNWWWRRCQSGSRFESISTSLFWLSSLFSLTSSSTSSSSPSSSPSSSSSSPLPLRRRPLSLPHIAASQAPSPSPLPSLVLFLLSVGLFTFAFDGTTTTAFAQNFDAGGELSFSSSASASASVSSLSSSSSSSSFLSSLSSRSLDKLYQQRQEEYYNNADNLLFQADQAIESKSSKSGANLVVVSGQKATLTCPLLTTASSSNKLLPSSSASSLANMQIKWLKEHTALPYDHRHHIQPNGSLVITSAQKRLDEGNYFCALAISHDELATDALTKNDLMKNSGIVNLQVIDPPRVGPYDFPADLQVGMKARAMCSVMQGDAPFRFAWTQDGRRIESDVPTSDSGALFRAQHFRDYSMLTVDSLTLAHAGNITCVVANEVAQTSQSAMLKVNAPPQWLVEPRDTSVVLHQSGRIDCLASGSPKPFTTWKRATGGNPWEYVPIYNSVHYYLHPNGSLSIMAATQVQAGPYICQSTNGYGADIGKLVQVKVNEPPRFSVQSQSQTAHKNEPIRLLCDPEGDRPIRMEWSLQNGTSLLQLARDNRRAVTSAASTASRSADQEEEEEEAGSATFPFDIKEIPRELLNSESNNADDGESNSVTIGVSRKAMSVSTSTSSGGTSSLVSVLTIRRPTRDDSRVYVCKASNDFGWAELKIRLSVKERPDIPDDFSIQNVTESSAEIRWREPFNGNSVVNKYVVEYRLIDIDSASSAGSAANVAVGMSTSQTNLVASGNNIGSSNNNVITTSVPIDRVTTINGSLRSTIVSGLRSNTYYNIRIAAQNQLGQGDFTAWTRLRTEQSAPESPPLDVTATSTGPNSVKISWKSPKKSIWNGDISGYYIGYRAENSDTDLYKTVENNSEETSGSGKFESHITNLHRSTVYEAWVQAFNARGAGPRSELVLVRTLADVPPSAPLLRLHSSSTESITISWSPAAFGSRSSNDLTLYYRPYQPAGGSSGSNSGSEHSNVNGGTVLRNAAVSPLLSPPNTWRDISILEPTGRHTVSGLECGRAYEFFATAHNSVGKSEPSTPLVARTRGDAPSPPPRGDLLAEIGSSGAVLHLLNWKNNECQISHFSMRIRTSKPISINGIAHGAASLISPSSWSVLTLHHNARENFVLRKLVPNTAYEIEVTAHSSAGSTQVVHHFVTANLSSSGETFFNKMGYDSKVSAAYPMPSSSSEINFSDYEILLPVISSLIVVVVIVTVACFLCSRDHHSLFLQPSGLHNRQRQPSASSENKVPFQQQEMSILKELVRSSSLTLTDSHPDSAMVAGMHGHAAVTSTDEYSCLNGLVGEPTSLTNSDHLNHHHLLNSPLHSSNSTKKDLVELQSFYHHHFHHAHDNPPTLQPAKNRPPNTGNYALPYDVLPAVNREITGNRIYGQHRPQSMNNGGNNNNNSAQKKLQQQQQPLSEPLYASTKQMGNYNHYCQKLDDSDSSSRNNSSSNRSNNYESLVPIASALESQRR